MSNQTSDKKVRSVFIDSLSLEVNTSSAAGGYAKCSPELFEQSIGNIVEKFTVFGEYSVSHSR